MTDNPDEPLLVLRVQSGDRAALEQLLLRMYERLRGYIVKLVGSGAADDLLQEVAVRVFQSLVHLRDPRAFWPWAYRIATRLAFRHLKREKKWRTFEREQYAPASELPRQFIEEDANSDLLSMVDRLPPASRAVLLLHYQQSLAIEETAAILAIPVGTAKSRLAYGIGKLRDFIKKEKQREHV